MKRYRNEHAGRRILSTYDQLLKKCDVEKEERDLVTPYGDTHVICCGSAGHPPLVLFHGVGDDAALMWLYNAKALARHFRLYAVDTLGGPGKSVPNENYNAQFDDVTWIGGIFSALGLSSERTDMLPDSPTTEPRFFESMPTNPPYSGGRKQGSVYLAGVSHGAYLAQVYALRRPECVIKIACMAGTVPAGDSDPLKTMMKIFLPEALLPTRGNTIRLLRKLCGKNSAVFTGNTEVLEHYRWLLRGFSPMSMRFHKLERFTDAEISAIREKTLYLIGEADPFARLGGKEMLLRHEMNARFFPEAGHGLNHELADEINAALIAWYNA